MKRGVAEPRDLPSSLSRKAVRTGRTAAGQVVTVTITPEGSTAANFGFDVTPARLVTALITERGSCPATRDGLTGLFPERG